MLKKRILASSLASVMALSSVSVVAFADETAGIETEAIDKAQLKEYVASFDGFLKADIYEFGTVQAEQFQDAIDYAETVIEDSDATTEEATAAYQMLKAVYNNLTMYTSADLKALIDENQDKYDSNNILNEDLGDHKWDTAKYDNFVNAFEDAEDVVDSEDGRLINDAYLDLKDAVKNLKLLDSVTKSQFRTVLKDYEAIIAKFSDYELWRRGECTVNPSTVTVKKDDVKIKLTDAEFVTFEQLKDIVYGDSKVCDGDAVLDSDGNTIEHDGHTLNCAAQWIKHGEASVEAFIEKQYKNFDEIKSANITTNTDIVNAYKAAKDAIAVFNGWVEDDTNRAVKASVVDIINDYRAKMVVDFASDLCRNVVTVTGKYTKKVNGVDTQVAYLEFNPDKRTLKATNDFKLTIDKETQLISLKADGTYNKQTEATETTEQRTIGKGQDIIKYIPITSDDVFDYILAIRAANLNNNEFEAAQEAYETDVEAVEDALDYLVDANNPATSTVDEDTANEVTIEALANYAGAAEANIVAAEFTVKKYTCADTDPKKAVVDAWNAAVDAAYDQYKDVLKGADDVVGSLAAVTTAEGTVQTKTTELDTVKNTYTGKLADVEDADVPSWTDAAQITDAEPLVLAEIKNAADEVIVNGATIKQFTDAAGDATTTVEYNGWVAKVQAASDARQPVVDAVGALDNAKSAVTTAKGKVDDAVATFNSLLAKVHGDGETKLEEPVATTIAVDDTKNIAALNGVTIDDETDVIIESAKEFKTYTDGGDAEAATVKDWNDAVKKLEDAISSLTTDTVNAEGEVTKQATKARYQAALDAGYTVLKYGVGDIPALANLGTALEIAEAYFAVDDKDFTDAYNDYLKWLDNNNIVADKPTGSRTEYTLIYRYLKYALEDLYPDTKSEKYTKRDVERLIEECYELAEKTGDAQIFAVNHKPLVEARKAALEWLTKANADKTYSEGKKVEYQAEYTLAGLFGAGDWVEENATDVYKKLKDLYDALADQFKYYPVSYGEIAELVSTVAAGLDNGAYGASADEIKALVEKVAFGLSTLNASDLDDEEINEPFTSDREFIAYNRLYTKSDAPNKANDDELALYNNYNALVKAIEEGSAEKPDVVKGDLTGDGVATPEDAVMIVKAFVGEITLTDAEKAAADFNGDSVVNADDALAIVKAYVGL